jgi:hypothetical protein
MSWLAVKIYLKELKQFSEVLFMVKLIDILVSIFEDLESATEV